MNIIFLKGRRFKFEDISYVSYDGITPSSDENMFTPNYKDNGKAVVRVTLMSGVEVVMQNDEAIMFLQTYDDIAERINNA